MNRRVKVSALAALAVSTLVLSACSKASDSAPGSSAAPAAGTSAAAPSSTDGSGTAAPSSESTSGGESTGSSAGTSAAGNVLPNCTPSTKANPYIAIVSKGFQHQFWQAVKSGAESKAKELGATITFDGPPTEQDIQTQLDQLKGALAKQPDAIGFAALDSQAAEPILEQAAAANVPIIAFDSGVDSDLPLTTASTDNKAAAAEAAKHMSELVGGKGTVALVVHDQTSLSGKDRRDGFLEWMKENAPDITVLDPQYGGGDVSKSADITKTIITQNPDIAGIYGSNEGSAIGVVQGVEESGKTGVKVVGFDSGQTQIDAITAGTESGAITQNPVGIGEQVVESAVKALKCEPLPATIDTGFYWYDKSNITEAKIAAVLYK